MAKEIIVNEVDIVDERINKLLEDINNMIIELDVISLPDGNYGSKLLGNGKLIGVTISINRKQP
ncbi:MAG: hypothetical protein KAS32_15860 [Candidatus Peribacteraceae bacterium]|nr:hypothetical protein [Candidatus Peribacteraceae bacterium]